MTTIRTAFLLFALALLLPAGLLPAEPGATLLAGARGQEVEEEEPKREEPVVAQDDEDEEEEDAGAAEPAAKAEGAEGEDEGEGDDEEEEEEEEKITSGTLSAFKLRSIGPALASGRVGDIAVDPRDATHWYIAVSSGGVWETQNAGTTWKPIFDGQKSYSIGCITIDPSDPDVLWVGTGENNSQRSVSWGDGVYRSGDGGKSWKHMGLAESEHIGMIAVDPRDSDVVWVAAQGPLWREGGDRGLYRTADGGATWTKVLEIDEHTGVSEVHLDPRNPDRVYATSYQRARRVWTLVNGGPGSGIWRSDDGGGSFRRIERGLPGGEKGRIGMDIAPANPDVLYAIVEATEGGGVFRSTNGGASWQKRNGFMTSSPQYYNEVFCDPTDADRVYFVDTLLRRSDDGGATLSVVPRRGRHVDDHALWIDPADPRHLVVGSDGGLYESHDSGDAWRFCPNLPVTQFYRLAVDNDLPFYNVYGGTQDNNTLGGPSRTIDPSGITNEEWFVVVGGDGFEPAVDPLNPDIVYGQWQHGGLVRYDRRSRESVDIKPRETPEDAPFRWNWDSPLLVSPHAPTRLWFGANVLFRSEDRGDSWTRVSDDLTRQLDRDHLEIMGGIPKFEAPSRHASTSHYGNLVALTESPLVEDLVYVGSDDGLVHRTEDGGRSWTRLEPIDGVPELAYVSCLLASAHDADTIYVAFDDHKQGNFAPMIFMSGDRGATWTSIASDLPEDEVVWAIAEDPVKPELLFVGGEFGLHVTLDGGGAWLRMKSGLPPIAVRDLAIQPRENDLVLATFGRGFYVLDDYAPLREIDETILEEDARILATRPALAYVPGGKGRGSQGATRYVASNPPFGATFTWWLKEKPKTAKELRREAERDRKKAGEPYEPPSYETLRAEREAIEPRLQLVVRDADGGVVRRLAAPRSEGLHRTTWDLRWSAFDGAGAGERAVPGSYTVELVREIDGAPERLAGPEPFEVVALGLATMPDPDRAATLAFGQEASRLQRALRGASRELDRADERIAFARRAADDLPGAPEGLRAEVEALARRAATLRMELRGDPTLSAMERPQAPTISQRVGMVVGSIWSTTSAPTRTQRDQLGYAAEAFATFLETLRGLDTDVATLEDDLLEAGAPYVPGRIPDWSPE